MLEIAETSDICKGEVHEVEGNNLGVRYLLEISKLEGMSHLSHLKL